MGLDVYVGPLTRYTLGDWMTIVQQALGTQGFPVEVMRAEPEPADVITDPVVVTEAVRSWQAGVLAALSCPSAWQDSPEMPYWTDKPDWDGYGGLVLLAAYDERPDLAPPTRQGLFRKAVDADVPRAWHQSHAYQRAASNPDRYPTLLSGVEWWLPIECGPTVFEVPRITGQPTRMGRVDQLVAELQLLTARSGLGAQGALDQVRHDGPPAPGADVAAAGRFGLAVMLELALNAQRSGQPLLLDY